MSGGLTLVTSLVLTFLSLLPSPGHLLLLFPKPPASSPNHILVSGLCHSLWLSTSAWDTALLSLSCPPCPSHTTQPQSRSLPPILQDSLSVTCRKPLLPLPVWMRCLSWATAPSLGSIGGQRTGYSRAYSVHIALASFP